MKTISTNSTHQNTTKLRIQPITSISAPNINGNPAPSPAPAPAETALNGKESSDILGVEKEAESLLDELLQGGVE